MSSVVLIVFMLVLELALALGVGARVMAQAYTDETPAQRDARMHWWRDARFGMFIHWGVYSVPAGAYQGKLSTTASANGLCTPRRFPSRNTEGLLDSSIR